MCELLGMSANTPTDICFSFAGLAKRGGKTGPHRDGWGIAFYEEKGCRLFHDPNPSAESELSELVKNYPIKSELVISHIRRANRGKICLANTHPFIRELWGQIWCFAHNGQLKGIKKEPLTFYQPVGTTDSEHAFCWLLDQIRLNFPKRPAKLAKLHQLIRDCCHQLNQKGVFNMIMSDSQHLYVHCGTRLHWITRRAPFGEAKLLDEEIEVDFSRETTPNDIVTIVATQPLTTNETWQKMGKNELQILTKGVFLKND
ncbi:MAG TPA: class II glutamine amidotransferase [Gammaproteobacteria bacterium]|nr:class II glutamine amidotransferase [Gammaproteobacteria bacterium]